MFDDEKKTKWNFRFFTWYPPLLVMSYVILSNIRSFEFGHQKICQNWLFFNSIIVCVFRWVRYIHAFTVCTLYNVHYTVCINWKKIQKSPHYFIRLILSAMSTQQQTIIWTGYISEDRSKTSRKLNQSLPKTTCAHTYHAQREAGFYAARANHKCN